MVKKPAAPKKPATPQEIAKDRNRLVVSYGLQRKLLGYLGLFLPLSLLAYTVFSGRPLEASISDFYYTQMGGVLIGTLSAIGVFLLAYNGYPREPGEVISDRMVSFFAGAGAIGVALFPVARCEIALCDPANLGCIAYGATAQPDWFHYLSAGLFFAAIAVFCFKLFPKGERASDGAARLTKRRMTYYACGGTIVVAFLALLTHILASWGQSEACIPAAERGSTAIFWWESLAVLAFAFAWLTKGEADIALREITRAVRQKLGGQ